MKNVLEIRDVSVDYVTARGRVRALRDVSFDVPPGEIVGIVGESGSGKSSLLSALIRLLPPNAEVTSGQIVFGGVNLLTRSEAELRAIRGRRMSVVFQDPMSSLNPVFTIGSQMIDIQYREHSSRAAKRARASEVLKAVGIADPDERLRQYPHELSGGMRQRVAIAMALLCDPQLLIADEPTTALDVTMEAQILHLFRELRSRLNGSILLISHNLGAIAEVCDRVIVMYAGEVVEAGLVRDVFHHPRHPYTRALLDCDPGNLAATRRVLPTIGGELPNLIELPPGCLFATRCPFASQQCSTVRPRSRASTPEHSAVCHL